MVVTTREKIKKAALSSFARKGYEGATMQEIAEVVGINKASIYNHFKGKEDLFLVVYQDAASKYEKLIKRLLKEIESMEIPDQLQHLFKEYILFFHQDLQFSLFWNQILIFPPAEMRKELYTDIAKREKPLETKMLEILSEGMRQGIIRRDIPAKVLVSYRAMRDGLLLWMRIAPELTGEWILVFWKDFWLGIKEQNGYTDESGQIQDNLNFIGGAKPQPSGRNASNEYNTTCLICNKEFSIPFSDFRYKDIKYKRSVHHVCNDCGKMVQEECQKITGLSPELLDLWEKIFPGKKK